MRQEKAKIVQLSSDVPKTITLHNCRIAVHNCRINMFGLFSDNGHPRAYQLAIDMWGQYVLCM